MTKEAHNMLDFTTSLGYSLCRLSGNADLFLSSCITHADAVQMGSLSMTLAAAALMAFFGIRTLA
jgi:hypothetical protein